MILRFSVENHRSIATRQELILVASSLKDRRDGLIDCVPASSGKVIPAALIYGANASGKTNFMDAVSTMRTMVLWSGKVAPGKGILPRKGFLLDPAWFDKPSIFEIDFVLDSVRYQYGFEATDESFTSEWLYEIPKAHKRKMFERDGQTFAFGRWLKGQNSSIARRTRPDSLFLSAAAQNKHEQLIRIFRYFRNLEATPSISNTTQIPEDRVCDQIIDFMKQMNMGITGYRKAIKDESILSLRKNLIQIQAKENAWNTEEEYDFEQENRNIKIQLSHRFGDGSKVYRDLDKESAGTQQMFSVLSRIFESLDKGHPVFIDNLNAGLHTFASEKILKMFCFPGTNPNGAQLVAAVHDTNLMCPPVIRRDQIFFAEKSHDGATTVFPLTDFRTRKEDNIEKGYLQGRYGGSPRGAMPEKTPQPQMAEPGM